MVILTSVHGLVAITFMMMYLSLCLCLMLYALRGVSQNYKTIRFSFTLVFLGKTDCNI